MKVFKILGLFILCISLVVPIGCSGKSFTSVVTGACNFLGPYLEDSKVAFAEIQKDYPLYAAIVTGKTNATMSEVVQARAWIAAADKALVILGAVVNGVCRSIKVADVQMALQISNETLPKTKIAPEKMKMLKMLK